MPMDEAKEWDGVESAEEVAVDSAYWLPPTDDVVLLLTGVTLIQK